MPADPTPSATAPGTTLRTLGRALLIFAGLFLLLSGYLGFVKYLFQTQWIKTGAEVCGGQIYEQVNDSTRWGVTRFYGFRCTVSFTVAGETRQSQLDFGPTFATRIDAEVWAARFPQGRWIPILYNPSDAREVRFAGETPPGYATAAGALTLACLFLVLGTLALLASRSEVVTEQTTPSGQ